MSDETLVQAPMVGATIGDGYELVRFIGAGGMGAVYEAVSTDGRRVAIKVLLDESLRRGGPDLLKRFRREVVVTSTLDNPHIVPTLDASVDEERQLPFMVMPLLVGLDLGQLVERIGPVHPTVAARIFRQACRALRYAHAQGVVHRDLKPGNLFLDHDKRGVVHVRVLDFGVAKWLAADAQLTQTGSMLGTPHYMAPEQIMDAKDVDPRCDVWGLGVSLYEALSDDVPFREVDSFAKLCVAITSEPTAPTLQEVAPWIDPALATVVHGALIRERDARCPSVDALAEALAAFAGEDDHLDARMFEPLPASLRQHDAPVAELPESWQVEAPRSRVLPPVVGDDDPLFGTTLGGYELLRCLGRGGMGAVYEARGDDDRRVAIKVVRPELAGTSASARRRFAREARLVQEIDSPHVVRIHHVAADDTHALPYVVMDLLQGADLAATVRQLGPLPPPVLARLFLQACEGLGAAHELGFVHRDVKPANLFLHRQPSGEIVLKVCDFGIAKEVLDEGDENITRTGGMLGSPMYMSPEQATDAKTIDHRTDVWSLGASLYHAACGAPPWEGRESVGELVLAVCTEPVPELQGRAPWISGELADVVREAMRKRPDERIASMAELAARLAPIAGEKRKVTGDDLRRLGRTTLARRPPRKVISVQPSSYASGVASTIMETPKRSRWPWLIGGAAAAAIGGAVIWAGRAGDVDSPAPATAMTAAVVEGELAVEPPGAEVLVDGERRDVRDGKLILSGEPGASFQVVVRHDGREHRQTIVLTSEGEPSAPVVALPEATAGPRASASADAEPPPRPMAPVPRATALPPPTLPTVASASPTTPPATSASSSPSRPDLYQDEF